MDNVGVALAVGTISGVVGALLATAITTWFIRLWRNRKRPLFVFERASGDGWNVTYKGRKPIVDPILVIDNGDSQRTKKMFDSMYTTDGVQGLHAGDSVTMQWYDPDYRSSARRVPSDDSFGLIPAKRLKQGRVVVWHGQTNVQP